MMYCLEEAAAVDLYISVEGGIPSYSNTVFDGRSFLFLYFHANFGRYSLYKRAPFYLYERIHNGKFTSGTRTASTICMYE